MMNKETKHFFYNNNGLNKGSIKEANEVYANKVRDDVNDILPSPEIMHAYEEIMPGTMEKLANLMLQEQKHKHAMEEARLNIQSKADFMGKVFAGFFVLAICYVTMELAKQSLNYAVIFSSCAFLSIFGMSMLSKYKNFKYYAKNIKAPYVENEKRGEHSGQENGWKNNKSNYRKPTYKKKF
jgi:uncharacterized membrane protein